MIQNAPTRTTPTLAALTLALAAMLSGSCSDAAPQPEAYVPTDFRTLSALDAVDFETAMDSHRREDHITAWYGDPATRDLVLGFFGAVTGSVDIGKAILDAAVDAGIPPGLAFALAHAESGYDPRAVHRNSASIDRGLFQLNSATFAKLTEAEFFDPAVNARHAMAHLEFCLQQGGNEVSALAIYNAGLTRVLKGGTPRRTLNYINDAISYRVILETLFEAQVVARGPGSAPLAASDGSPELAAADLGSAPAKD